MHTYVLLKDGRQMVLFSDEGNKLAVFPVGELEGGYDPEFVDLEVVPLEAVKRIDTDRFIAYA